MVHFQHWDYVYVKALYSFDSWVLKSVWYYWTYVNKSLHLSPHKNGQALAVPAVKENTIAGLGELEIPYLAELHFWDNLTSHYKKEGQDL